MSDDVKENELNKDKYNAYCIMKYNYLETLCRYYSFNKQKNFKFYCFGDKRDNHNDLVFHPKMYLFETALSRNTKYASIIGSSNLTGGGLTSNFEVNSIFRENTPKYYSQLEAIYNEIH